MTAGLALLLAGPVAAQVADTEELLRELADPATEDWQRVESDLLREWSKSGSPSMDLLLQRGQEALEAGDPLAALEHLTALTDHAPDFAEGWNLRATAFFVAGQFGPALEDIRQTLALNPQHYGALAGLGMILEQLEREEDAAAAYRAALAVNPHQPDLNEALTRLDQATGGTEL
ncbi:tetratricopeptide repeat protein [Frigidibacter sp.]|uniref:tetratricopeptide repeat protein n=1 Tax=Frigidibacter sp. TaxID=2586418 RepID=UPI002735A982|nr:tetratricopeptide repeat protein [Frigidibacter sp.]MDP3340857.1 tetratricopeptide repeat protein [Frigidibacter sp.]